nr:hypothetical protein [Tanacetum cinerariifolium]
MSNDRESSAAGTDSRAPMLEESEYESWKIRMRRYLRGKPNGRQIWDSVMNGPALTESAKEMWDNIELLMKGSGLTEQRKKKELYDEYERFRAIGNEPIHDYFVCFHKLINDLKITKLAFEAHQKNTKFLNNLPPHWAKCHATVNDGQIVTKPTQRKSPGNVSRAGTSGTNSYAQKTEKP